MRWLALLAKSLTNYTVFAPEITMPNVNLSWMKIEALLDLQKRVDAMLGKHRWEIEKRVGEVG